MFLCRKSNSFLPPGLCLSRQCHILFTKFPPSVSFTQANLLPLQIRNLFSPPLDDIATVSSCFPSFCLVVNGPVSSSHFLYLSVWCFATVWGEYRWYIQQGDIGKEWITEAQSKQEDNIKILCTKKILQEAVVHLFWNCFSWNKDWRHFDASWCFEECLDWDVWISIILWIFLSSVPPSSGKPMVQRRQRHLQQRPNSSPNPAFCRETFRSSWRAAPTRSYWEQSFTQ